MDDFPHLLFENNRAIHPRFVFRFIGTIVPPAQINEDHAHE